MSPHPERPVQVSRDVLGSERIPPGAMGLSVFLITSCLLQPGTDLQASLTLMALQLLKIPGQSLWACLSLWLRLASVSSLRNKHWRCAL